MKNFLYFKLPWILMGCILGVVITTFFIFPFADEYFKTRIKSVQKDTFNENIYELFLNQSPLASLLKKPLENKYSTDELRNLTHQWMQIQALEQYNVQSATITPFKFSEIFTKEEYGLTYKDIPSPYDPWKLLTIKTEIGLFRVLLFEPKQINPPNQVAIVQHGHEGFSEFHREFSWITEHLTRRNIPVFYPLQAHFFRAPEEYQISLRLHLMGLDSMGIRVFFLKLLLDWINENYTNTSLTFIGHSGGANIGYYTSIIDPRIENIALDLTPQKPKDIITTPLQSEYIFNMFALLDQNGEARRDILRAKNNYIRKYGYPDREGLINWLDSTLIE